MRVNGFVTPALVHRACRLISTSEKSRQKDLNIDTGTLLETQDVPLSVKLRCQQRCFAIQPIDNRAGSALTVLFGLGYDHENQKLGRYCWRSPTRWQKNPLPCWPCTTLTGLGDGCLTKSLAPTYWWRWVSGRQRGLGPPKPIKDAVMDVTLESDDLTPQKTLTLTDEVAIDGSATFEVNSTVNGRLPHEKTCMHPVGSVPAARPVHRPCAPPAA